MLKLCLVAALPAMLIREALPTGTALRHLLKRREEEFEQRFSDTFGELSGDDLPPGRSCTLRKSRGSSIKTQDLPMIFFWREALVLCTHSPQSPSANATWQSNIRVQAVCISLFELAWEEDWALPLQTMMLLLFTSACIHHSHSVTYKAAKQSLGCRTNMYCRRSLRTPSVSQSLPSSMAFSLPSTYRLHNWLLSLCASCCVQVRAHCPSCGVRGPVQAEQVEHAAQAV